MQDNLQLGSGDPENIEGYEPIEEDRILEPRKWKVIKKIGLCLAGFSLATCGLHSLLKEEHQNETPSIMAEGEPKKFHNVISEWRSRPKNPVEAYFNPNSDYLLFFKEGGTKIRRHNSIMNYLMHVAGPLLEERIPDTRLKGCQYLAKEEGILVTSRFDPNGDLTFLAFDDERALTNYYEAIITHFVRDSTIRYAKEIQGNRDWKDSFTKAKTAEDLLIQSLAYCLGLEVLTELDEKKEPLKQKLISKHKEKYLGKNPDLDSAISYARIKGENYVFQIYLRSPDYFKKEIQEFRSQK